MDSETTLKQQEIQLKNLLSRNGTADPVLRDVRILPVDPIRIPDRDDIPPLEELVRQAIANRPDLASEREGEAASAISNLGTKSAVLPTGIVFGSTSQVGLAGTARPILAGGSALTPPSSLTGGLGAALGQAVSPRLPVRKHWSRLFHAVEESAGAGRLCDRRADPPPDATERTAKTVNQVQVDVGNYLVALRQARARYDAMVRNRILQEELYKSERRRFELGASIAYNVNQQQRDLIAAQSSEVAARVAYITARIALEQTTGEILSANHVSLAEAREGKVNRQSVISEPPVGR